MLCWCFPALYNIGSHLPFTVRYYCYYYYLTSLPYVYEATLLKVANAEAINGVGPRFVTSVCNFTLLYGSQPFRVIVAAWAWAVQAGPLSGTRPSMNESTLSLEWIASRCRWSILGVTQARKSNVTDRRVTGLHVFIVSLYILYVQFSSVCSEIVLRPCRPAWTDGFSVHVKTVDDWWRVSDGVEEVSFRWQEQTIINSCDWC